MAGNKERGICSALTSALFEYDTNKVVHIRSKTIGITNRLVQFTIICYVIVYVIIIKKGYQDTERPYSSVTTKVKGTALTNLTSTSGQSFPLYGGVHLWDSPDYIVPPEEGVRTGKCVPADRGKDLKAGLKVCQIYSWCPVEIDVVPMPDFNLTNGEPLLDTENFTVLIKNNVQFPKFKESKYENSFVRNLRQLSAVLTQTWLMVIFHCIVSKWIFFPQGGKFNIVPLLVNIGSGLALLGIATVFCDIVVLYVVKGKTYYRTQKYQYVHDPDHPTEVSQTFFGFVT
ncbi:PREDICTED: P2X purinoceptor 4-like [Acropora digitifera]|uniref:P2X purinoceptor 4-like n=1 Tax=Acropora digitifera TaxID=70779 RepID=UPI00077A052A|nr:PREDICTED: P2X purinoceptor 4-like [Acropora digitifera]